MAPGMEQSYAMVNMLSSNVDSILIDLRRVAMLNSLLVDSEDMPPEERE